MENFYPAKIYTVPLHPQDSLPAGVHRKILGVVSVFLILLKVQLCQQLTGLHHRVVSVLQQTVGAINLWRQVQGNFVSAWCGGGTNIKRSQNALNLIVC